MTLLRHMRRTGGPFWGTPASRQVITGNGYFALRDAGLTTADAMTHAANIKAPPDMAMTIRTTLTNTGTGATLAVTTETDTRHGALTALARSIADAAARWGITPGEVAQVTTYEAGMFGMDGECAA